MFMPLKEVSHSASNYALRCLSPSTFLALHLRGLIPNILILGSLFLSPYQNVRYGLCNDVFHVFSDYNIFALQFGYRTVHHAFTHHDILLFYVLYLLSYPLCAFTFPSFGMPMLVSVQRTDYTDAIELIRVHPRD